MTAEAVAPARRASGSPTTCAAAILGGEIAPGRADPAGGGRRSGWAPAGCRCARRCGCSRPRGWPSTRPTRAPGCRGWTGTRSTSIYQMRERLEPLALTESLPHLTDAEIERLAGDPGRDRGRRATRPVPRAGPRVPPRHVRRLPDRAARRDGRPAVEHHPALPPGVHAAVRAGPELGGQRRAPAAARRGRGAGTRSTPSGSWPGTSAAPGSSCPTTPRCSEGCHERARGSTRAALIRLTVNGSRVESAPTRTPRCSTCCATSSA